MQNSDTVIKYMMELAQLQTATQHLLQNIKEKVDQIPDRRDFKDNITKLDSLTKALEKISESLTEHCDDAVDSQKLIDNIKKIIEEYNIALRNINKMLTDNASPFLNQINTIEKISKMLLTEINDTKIRLGNDMFNLTDINEIIVYAKRANARHNYFSGWKKVVAICIGAAATITIILKPLIETIALLLSYL